MGCRSFIICCTCRLELSPLSIFVPQIHYRLSKVYSRPFYVKSLFRQTSACTMSPSFSTCTLAMDSFQSLPAYFTSLHFCNISGLHGGNALDVFISKQTSVELIIIIIIIIPEQFTAIGPTQLYLKGRRRGEGGGSKKKTTRFFNTFIPVYIHIHIQYQTSKSNISKTVRDREKVSMEVR